MFLLRLTGVGAESRWDKFVVEFLLLTWVQDRANLKIRGDHQAAALAL